MIPKEIFNAVLYFSYSLWSFRALVALHQLSNPVNSCVGCWLPQLMNYNDLSCERLPREFCNHDTPGTRFLAAVCRWGPHLGEGWCSQRYFDSRPSPQSRFWANFLVHTRRAYSQAWDVRCSSLHQRLTQGRDQKDPLANRSRNSTGSVRGSPISDESHVSSREGVIRGAQRRISK